MSKPKKQNAEEKDLAVVVQGLDFSYGTEQILQNISFSLQAGKFLALIGPNGGGKTTLLRLLLGFLQPSVGSISIFGGTPKKQRELIGYVPQFSAVQADFPASVLETVLMGQARANLRGGVWETNQAAKDRALHYLALLGVETEADSPLFSLSGGQKQRVLVARALMGCPEPNSAPFLLLLDEPTASIDPLGKNCFYEFLDTLRGVCSAIIVSHDLLLASPYFDAIALVHGSLTLLPDKNLDAATLEEMYGTHRPECPLGMLQQFVNTVNQNDKSHAGASNRSS